MWKHKQHFALHHNMIQTVQLNKHFHMNLCYYDLILTVSTMAHIPSTDIYWCYEYILFFVINTCYIYNWRMKNNEILYLWTTLYHRHTYKSQNMHTQFNISCESSLQTILVNNGLVYICQNMILITGKNWILTNILLQKCPSLAIR
jgi:hypothetical protein